MMRTWLSKTLLTAVRAGLAAAAFLTLGLAAESAQAETLKFKVLQNGKSLGTHVVSLSRKGESTFVNSDLDLQYKIGPITIFHYRSVCAETWKANRLDRMSCRIDKSGQKSRIDVARAGDQLIIAHNGKRVRSERSAVPVSPWNALAMRSSKAK